MNSSQNQELEKEITRPYHLPVLPDNMEYVETLNADSIGDGTLVFNEDSDDFDQYTYRVSRVLYTGKTRYQNVLIADTYNWGLVLVLDGAIQSAEDDESLYHEMLVQPAMLRHPNPKDVLIIGGGEGATLREVLVHPSVQSATMVDLDQQVVELCREHLPTWHRGAFEDPRVRLIFDDGRKFVDNDSKLYDVVIIDVVDMLNNGPAQSLYTREFYQKLRERLKPGALVVVQGLEFSFLDDKEHAALARTLRTVFPEVHSYRTDIPSFLSAWGFIIASDWFRPSDWTPEQINLSIEKKLGTKWLRHVDGNFLKSAYALSKKTRFLISLDGPILEDGVEFIAPPEIEEDIPEFMKFPLTPEAKS